MSSETGVARGSPTRKLWGPRVALVGVLLSAVAGWVYGAANVPRNHWELDDVWLRAGLVYMPGALFSMAVGLLVPGFWELVRRGPVARRFARAEWRNLRAGGGWMGRILWGALLLAGLVALLLLFYTRHFWMPASADGRLRLYRSDLVEVICVSAVFLSFGVSILLPLVVAAGAAVNLSASRRSGAAQNLLMAPLAADYLGWAAVRAQVRRAAWMILAAVPAYLITLMLLASAWRRYALLPIPWTVVLLLPLVVFIELMMLRRSAALGVWLGTIVPVPALAAALAAVTMAIIWLLRLLLIFLCFAIAYEGWRRTPLGFWMWPTLAVVGEVLFFALLTPLLMWLIRGSLAAPVGLRLGAWMIRVGERISGLGTDVRAKSAPRPAPGRRFALWGRDAVRLGWKTVTAGVWVLAVLVFIAYPVSAELAREFRWADAAGNIFGLTLFLLLGLFASGWLHLRYVAWRVRVGSVARDR